MDLLLGVSVRRNIGLATVFGCWSQRLVRLTSNSDAQSFWPVPLCVPMLRAQESHCGVLKTLESSFLSLADENIRPTAPLSMVRTL